ncbi:MAG: RNA methyltransferase [Flammeovirgaceae bacterium]|nr:MAG: RNA methyltransferase [Flammeovirgaceae bacterium]
MPLSANDYKLIEHLGEYITKHRKQLIDQVLDSRTRHLTVVLENIYQSHNASAVVRSCECMGLQDIHIIEGETPYQVNKKVLKGSYKWVNVMRYKSKDVQAAKSCFGLLKAKGYSIVITDPAGEVSIHELDPTLTKTALVFGNEDTGVSDYARSHAIGSVRIPMYGFTESMNISVSVAICLNVLMTKLRTTDWKYGLTPDERDELKLAWYRKIVKRSDLIEKRFMQSIA